MKYLITGTPHSGTRYMAFLFRAYGLDIDHEAMGADGTSCWAWGAPDAHRVAPPWSPGLRPILDDSWTVIHIYRDPLVCIPALAADSKPETLEFLTRFIPEDDDPLTRAVATYSIWNLLIQDMAPEVTINVEAAEGWAAANLGRRWFPLPNSRVNSRARGRRQALTWEQVLAAHPAAGRMVRDLAHDRGYVRAA